jgi:hypothetical protein
LDPPIDRYTHGALIATSAKALVPAAKDIKIGKAFRPRFMHKSETTISVITLYFCLQLAAEALFGIDRTSSTFSKAVIDHSEALTSGILSLGGPNTDIGMCYPHVPRIFLHTKKWMKEHRETLSAVS